MTHAATKRALDLAGATFGLLLLCPLILLVALTIAIVDGRPAFFRQIRVGRDERLFSLWKLRSMRKGTENVATHLASRQSVTRLGAILRRTKLDELPQLWNVFRGEMSLVGPRPCLPTQADVIQARRRHGVQSQRPGITGLSQISGYEFATPEETAALDAEYAANASLAGDLALILRTVLGLSKDNADARMSD